MQLVWGILLCRFRFGRPGAWGGEWGEKREGTTSYWTTRIQHFYGSRGLVSARVRGALTGAGTPRPPLPPTHTPSCKRRDVAGRGGGIGGQAGHARAETAVVATITLGRDFNLNGPGPRCDSRSRQLYARGFSYDDTLIYCESSRRP